jgi:inosose dehydratase
MKRTIFIMGLIISLAVSAQNRPDPQPSAETNEKFNIGMAGYTFRNFNLDQTLDMMQKCDVKYLCIKDFHLPLNSNEKEIADFHAKLASKGIKGYAVFNNIFCQLLITVRCFYKQLCLIILI